MSVDRAGGTIARIDLRRVEATLRVVAAALPLAIAWIGLRNGDLVLLWLVPVAWAILALDPRRDGRDDREG